MGWTSGVWMSADPYDVLGYCGWALRNKGWGWLVGGGGGIWRPLFGKCGEGVVDIRFWASLELVVTVGRPAKAVGLRLSSQRNVFDEWGTECLDWRVGLDVSGGGVRGPTGRDVRSRSWPTWWSRERDRSYLWVVTVLNRLLLRDPDCRCPSFSGWSKPGRGGDRCPVVPILGGGWKRVANNDGNWDDVFGYNCRCSCSFGCCANWWSCWSSFVYNHSFQHVNCDVPIFVQSKHAYAILPGLILDREHDWQFARWEGRFHGPD